MQKEDSNFLLYENHSIMNTKIRITGRWSESSGIHDDIGAKSGFLILESAADALKFSRQSGELLLRHAAVFEQSLHVVTHQTGHRGIAISEECRIAATSIVSFAACYIYLHNSGGAYFYADTPICTRQSVVP